MLTLRELLEFQIPAKEGDRTSGPMLKLLLITIWTNQGRGIMYKDMCKVIGCGERTVYRATRTLRNLGIIDGRPSRGDEGTRWEIYEHIVRRMLNAQQKRGQKEPATSEEKVNV